MDYGSITHDQRKAPQQTKMTRNRNSSTIEHLGKHRQYWRDIILGVNDGLISTFLLVAGVVGSGLSPNDILLTTIAGALAGAVSMSTGEFVATKSQNEVLQGEIGLEREHIRDNHAAELGELNKLLDVIGIPVERTELRSQMFDHYGNNDESLLKLMVALEFGIVEEEGRSPILAALTSGMLFVAGSLPSLLPFAIGGANSTRLLYVATLLVILALLLVGALKTWATRGNCLSAALENLIIASVGGLLAYYVGVFFNQVIK